MIAEELDRMHEAKTAGQILFHVKVVKVLMGKLKALDAEEQEYVYACPVCDQEFEDVEHCRDHIKTCGKDGR